MKKITTFSILLALIFTIEILTIGINAKKKKQGAEGSPFATQNTMMVFIEIRDGYVSPQGIKKMAGDFQQMMSAGGLQVGIVGTEGNQMVAIAQSIRELVEIRKFAISLEEVLLVSYDKSKFPGNHITEAERKKHELPKKKKEFENDDL